MPTLENKLSFSQILNVIKSLSPKDKIKISKELEKDGINSKLHYFLTAFKTAELSEKSINEAVERVRKKSYEKNGY
jgi:archaellum biogenesis protein FlaJ (TadC family)